jgi:multidrug efflux system outer membrane protein
MSEAMMKIPTQALVRAAALLAFALAIAAIGLLSGCAVGPDYHKPATPVAPSFDNTIAGNAEPEQQFWHAFHDPELDQLVSDALVANHDIRIAVANLREARAVRVEVGSQGLPTVGVQADAGREILPQTETLGATTTREQRTTNVFDVGLDASWELDFFGRYRRAAEAADATVTAAEASVQDAQISVIAEVARNYFQLRGEQRQLAVAQDAVTNQEANLNLVEARLSAGRGTELDRARARSQVENTRSIVPTLEAAIARSSYRLAVLTGRSPTELAALVREAKPLPALAPVNGIGTPEALLRRRPDIRIAERQLAASSADIGVSTADLFPHVSITGLLGLNAGTIGALGQAQAFVYNLGASATWTLFDFGQRRARVTQAEARNDAALARYQKAVLIALEETEAALVTFNRTERQADSLFDAARDSEQAAKIARIRFENGATDFLTVLDAERQVLADQNGLAQAQTAAGTSLIAIYKALGAGWPTATTVAAR